MYTSALVYANSYMRQNWCQGSWTRTQIRINRIDAIWRLYHILLLTTCRMLSRRMTFQHGLLSINGRWQNHAVSAVIAHPASSFRFCLCEYITNSYSIQRSRWIYRGGNERIKMALTGMKRLDSFTIRFYTIQYSICGRLKVLHTTQHWGPRATGDWRETMTCLVFSISIVAFFEGRPALRRFGRS